MRKIAALGSQSVIVSLFSISIVMAQPPRQGGGPPGNPFGGEDRKVLEQFDENDDAWLNVDERAAARIFMKANPVEGRGFGPGGGPPGGRPPRGGFGGPDPQEIFRLEDGNSDGVLSSEELSDSPFADRFTEIDIDKMAMKRKQRKS